MEEEKQRKKFLKHPPFEQGRRTHVEHWVGIIKGDGALSSIIRCSEPDCELNKKIRYLMRWKDET